MGYFTYLHMEYIGVNDHPPTFTKTSNGTSQYVGASGLQQKNPPREITNSPDYLEVQDTVGNWLVM